MTAKQRGQHKLRSGYVALGALLAGLAGAPAQAIEFNFGEVEGSFNSDLSYGISLRADDRVDRLIFPGNKDGGKASGSLTDDGDLNFDKNDVFSSIFKGVHDLEFKYRDYGVFLRGKWWYDYELERKKVPHGHGPNNYEPDDKLNDSGFSNFAKFSGAQMLDAFAYASFNIKDKPLDLRFGRQVISWGESTFIQGGINIINPIDVTAFRKPGAEIKEGLLPVEVAFANFGISDNLSLEAFYQLKWRETEIDGCGTYFSDIDIAADGCDRLTIQPTLFDDQFAVDNGIFAKRGNDDQAKDSGQFGVALRYYSEPIDTEFGAYYINYHSRLPYFNGYKSSNPAGTAPFIPGDPFGGNPKYIVVWPENISVYGLSFATNIKGWALSGEFSYRPNFPVQINSTELLQAALTDGAAVWSTFSDNVIFAAPGQQLRGYDTYEVSQIQATVIKNWFQRFGADTITLVGEVGATFTGSLPSKSERRYGRSPTFGIGAFDPINLGPAGQITCESGNAVAGIPAPNSNRSNCTNNGYVTSTAWGYRLRAVFSYPNVVAGINFKPSIAWSHDVNGNSPNGIFLNNRKAISFGLAADYLQRYKASISYTAFFDGRYNTQKDRDFIAMSVGMSF